MHSESDIYEGKSKEFAVKAGEKKTLEWSDLFGDSYNNSKYDLATIKVYPVGYIKNANVLTLPDIRYKVKDMYIDANTGEATVVSTFNYDKEVFDNVN